MSVSVKKEIKKDWYVGMDDGEGKNDTHNLKYLYGFHPGTTHVHTTLPHLRALVDQHSSGDQDKPPCNPPRLAVHAGVHELPAN